MQHEHGKTAPLAAPPLLDPRRHALFLDLDGTLLELKERPHDVRASPELLELLRRVSAEMSGAVAVITGRTISDTEAILQGALNFIAGVHGYEMLRGGHIAQADARLTRLEAARGDVRQLLRDREIPALVEDKGASLALHYRHAPESGAEVRRIAAHIAKSRGLRVLEGKMVVELIASARTKGHALTVFMAQPPFAGRTPIAIGDDRTDEDAFAAAGRLGGWGVLVGASHDSGASYTLAGPAAVAAWLASSTQQ
jgi:trehalose 6-phosphate phosphatase